MAPAMARESLNETSAGRRHSTQAKATAMPAIITAICCFWVWLTALVPPTTVYTMTSPPTATLVTSSDHPRTLARMMAGA